MKIRAVSKDDIPFKYTLEQEQDATEANKSSYNLYLYTQLYFTKIVFTNTVARIHIFLTKSVT